MKKIIALIIMALTFCFCMCGLVACTTSNDKENGTKETAEVGNDSIVSVYNSYVQYAEANNQTPLAYELWLSTIKGADGTNGVNGITPKLKINELTNFWEVSYDNGATWINLNVKAIGADGKDGVDGINGTNGKDGKDGKGIVSTTVDRNGDLIIVYTDGTSVNAGHVTNPLKESEGLEYELINEGTEYCVVGTGDCCDSDIIIPATYNDKPVTAIGEYAFCGEDAYGISVTSINIPDSVKKIGEGAFGGNVGLVEVKMSNNVEEIGEGAFEACISLKKINLPESLSVISEDCFAECIFLFSIEIPSSVTVIEEYAFDYCLYLTNINYNGTIEDFENIEIGKNAWRDVRTDKVTCTDGVVEISNTGKLPYGGNKIQIKIYSYNGGVGNEWLDGTNININGRSFKSIKEAFEEAYADYTSDKFPGKKGVELVITKDLIEGNTQFDSMAGEEYEIYFSDKSKYIDMVRTGKVKDISDVYNQATYSINGGNVNADGSTILSNLTKEQKDYFGFSGGKYYALPHYSSYGGLNYNKQVFNNYKLYFGRGGCPSEFDRDESDVEGIAPSVSGSFVEEIHVNASGVDDEGDTIGLSAGPDGKYGTYDDGLPATYEDFFMLCDYMVAHNVIPFTWSDTYGIAYMNSLLGYLRADYEGKDQLRLFYDPDGFVNEAGETINTAKNLIKFNGDEPIVDGINIEKEQLAMTNAKGYEMFRSAGFYYATYFLSQMMSDGSYLNWHYTGTSHTQAQEQFVKSEFYNGFSDAGNPVAFLVEGNYWYNEAKLNGIFNQPNNDGKTTDYGLLPVPKVDASLIGTRTTINIGLGNLVYVNANTSDDKMPLITEFLKFCYSDERLSDFTAITGMPKGLNYDLGDKRDCLSSYYKSVWDLTYNSNTDVVYAVSDNAIFLNTPAYFNDYPFRTTDQMYMLVEFTRNPSISASEVFKSLVDYRSQVAYNAEFFYVINGGKIN